MRIGVSNQTYQEKKSIIGMVADCDYILLRDLFWLFRKFQPVSRISSLVTRKLDDSYFKFYDFDLNRVDLIHLYNSVSFGKKPWVATFETVIPRYQVVLSGRGKNAEKMINDSEVQRALIALASEPCKNLIANTQNSVIMQNEFLSFFPDIKECVSKKQVVIDIPQVAYPRSPAKQDAVDRSRIVFMIVGHQIFSKGGREIVDVISQLRRETGRQIDLVIVSALGVDHYCTLTNQADVTKFKKMIDENKAWITHYPLLSNEEVLRLMETADVGLLPSYAETYGFSVLEFQANGCPVITTDIRAFPHINNDKIGWLIPVAKHSNGEAKYRTADERHELSEQIRAGLYRTISEIVSNEEVIAEKGANAHRKIAEQHNPMLISSQLISVYRDALR